LYFNTGLYDNLGLELWIQIIMFSFFMFACFYTWYRVEGTLAVHSINTSRREVFYWLTILFTFALGTAVGDYISTVWPVSFGDILGLFWSAYIMTRPLGAAKGDFLGQNKAKGGLGLGYEYTSLLFIGLIIIIVCGLTYTGIDRIVIITPQSEADAKVEEEQDAYTKVVAQEKVKSPCPAHHIPIAVCHTVVDQGQAGIFENQFLPNRSAKFTNGIRSACNASHVLDFV
jgi:hypothetical protein